jgi:hypothetical protein
VKSAYYYTVDVMFSDNEMERDPRLWVRIILKIPKLSLESFSDSFHGYWWILAPPVFITIEFYMNLLLLTCITFPFNIISFLSVNTIIALLFTRILVERTLCAERAILNEGCFHWDLERSLDEYLSSNRGTQTQTVLTLLPPMQIAEESIEKE